MSLRNAVAVIVSLLSASAFAQEATSTSVSVRPEGLTVGVGAGWSFPQSILEPNTVSVRVKTGKLTFEPLINVSGRFGNTETSTRTDVGAVNTTVEDEDRTSGLSLSLNANVRYALTSAGPVDFVAIGGVGVGYGQSSLDADVLAENQSDERTNSELSASLNWGVGVEWLLSRNISLSADATNPLVSWTRSTEVRTLTDTSGVEPVSQRIENESSNFTGGVTFRPTVRLMFHLYF